VVTNAGRPAYQVRLTDHARAKTGQDLGRRVADPRRGALVPATKTMAFGVDRPVERRRF